MAIVKGTALAPACAAKEFEESPKETEMARTSRIEKQNGWRWLTAMGLVMSLVAGIVISDTARARAADNPTETATKTALAQYTHDITSAAEQGRFDASTDRQVEINHAIEILAGARKNNPVVLTDSQAI